MKSYFLGITYIMILAGFYPYSKNIDAVYPSNLGTNLYLLLLLLCIPLIIFVMNKITKKEKIN